MTKFDEIFNKLVKENTEASISSEEMINQNSTSLEDMSFTTVEPGKFDSSEITDAANVNANLENPLADQDSDDSCEHCDNEHDDETIEDLEKDIIGLGAITFESKFEKAFEKVLSESDYIHRKMTPDSRVNHNDVTLALRKELNDNQVSVDSIDNNQSFKVSYIPKDKKLPKTLNVEQEVFELNDDNIYTPKSTNTETVLK